MKRIKVLYTSFSYSLSISYKVQQVQSKNEKYTTVLTIHPMLWKEKNPEFCWEEVNNEKESV